MSLMRLYACDLRQCSQTFPFIAVCFVGKSFSGSETEGVLFIIETIN